MNLDAMIKKLAKPYWMPTNPADVFDGMQLEHYGQLNLTWILCGRVDIYPGYFDTRMARWKLANQIGQVQLDGGRVIDYAHILSEEEFREQLFKHQNQKLMPLQLAFMQKV